MVHAVLAVSPVLPVPLVRQVPKVTPVLWGRKGIAAKPVQADRKVKLGFLVQRATRVTLVREGSQV
jgi:hypothetical protein